MFDCEEREFAPEWDGHTPDEAIARIATLGSETCERTYHPNRSRASGPQLTCSECGYGASDDRWAFCPKCGARYENTCHEAIRAVSE
jgi:rubrerythrin